MCVVSMVTDYYREQWEPRIPQPYFIPMPGSQPAVTDAEILEFRKLLERAREYDRRTGQPDCELEEKRAALKAIAEKLGIDISFVDAA